ncbi:hypothetical protein Taro_056361 [Colocasia esculenta]|uniref:Uncharacterized protein n=1 Tax=Colocasia esculenta TaxID=4460 RepID=A0A843XX42_COLES|nr:hypothetical protein [Colocasia esculenta]
MRKKNFGVRGKDGYGVCGPDGYGVREKDGFVRERTDLVLPEVLLESNSVSLVFRPDFSEFCPIRGGLPEVAPLRLTGDGGTRAYPLRLGQTGGGGGWGMPPIGLNQRHPTSDCTGFGPFVGFEVRMSFGDRNIVRKPRGEATGSGHVDHSLILKENNLYQYERPEGYPKHFPTNADLFPFIQSFVPADQDDQDPPATAEKCQLERAILEGRDSLFRSCYLSFPSFPLRHIHQTQFPAASQLAFFGTDPDCYVKGRVFISTAWEVSGRHSVISSTAPGLFLSPSGMDFVTEGYSKLCMLDRLVDGSTPSWYGQWFVIPSHRFHLGATEWLMGILHHHGELLGHVGIRHAVTAGLYKYPCHSGLLQALAERFNQRFNTFATAEGVIGFDLWSFHHISGLPIHGRPYEEVVLHDLQRNASTGTGNYTLPLCF